MPDARELFNAPPATPTPPPTPEPTSAPVEVPVVSVAVPVEPIAPAQPEVLAPAQQTTQDGYARLHNETMAAINIIDPTGELASQVREVRRQGVDYYPSVQRPQSARQPNGQFAPAPQTIQPAEPAVPRYVSEMTVEELAAFQAENINRAMAEAAQVGEYQSVIRNERQQVWDQFQALATPRQVIDEMTGQPIFIKPIPQAEVDAAWNEALTYGIDTAVPQGAATHGRLARLLLYVNHLKKSGQRLPTSPNPTAANVATPPPGAPSMPAVSAERQELQKKIDAYKMAERKTARQVFSGQ